MKLNLPECQRIMLTQPPIEDVICQVRFAPLMDIALEPPRQFHTAIATLFPVFDSPKPVPSPQDAKQKAMSEKGYDPPRWKFTDQDQSWRAYLYIDFLAVETTAYSRFEAFLRRVQGVAKAFTEIYGLAIATRVGLRYINRVSKPRSTSMGVWLDGLNEFYASSLTPHLLVDTCARTWHEVHILQPDGDKDPEAIMGIRYGVERPEGDDKDYLVLDFDCFTESDVSFEDLEATLLRYHDLIYRAFRWSFQENLFSSFEPQG
ncbi:MAG: TIGR04255 family protein [Armatimonadetes bacterium]|nr:TIGR04255 family protein [Armatimonadota bacterium]